MCIRDRDELEYIIVQQNTKGEGRQQARERHARRGYFVWFRNHKKNLRFWVKQTSRSAQKRRDRQVMDLPFIRFQEYTPKGRQAGSQAP